MLWDIFTVFTRWRLWKGAVSEGQDIGGSVFNSLPWLAGVCVTFPDLGLRAGHSLAVTVIHQCHGLVNDPSAGHDGSPLTWKPNQKEFWTKAPALLKTPKLKSLELPAPSTRCTPPPLQEILFSTLPDLCTGMFWVGFFSRKATNLSPVIIQLTVSHEQQLGLSPSGV